MIRLIEELRGEKMSEKEKRQPEKRGEPIPPEVQKLIDELCDGFGVDY